MPGQGKSCPFGNFEKGIGKALHRITVGKRPVGQNGLPVTFVRFIFTVVVGAQRNGIDLFKAHGDVADALAEKIYTIGEKLSIRRFAIVEGVVSTYIHGLGATGGVVSFETNVADKPEFVECSKNVALQTAAMPVQYLDAASVPAEVLEEEKRILTAQMQQDPKMANKPANVLEKIVEGRLSKFYENNCLLHQLYVKDDSMTVAKYVESVAKALGGSIKVTGYVRYDKGEGLEKREEDFAAEIQKMVKG